MRLANLVTPPNPLSTTKADILSFVSPVLGSVTGVWAKTVKISAIPPLLILEKGQKGGGNTCQVKANAIQYVALPCRVLALQVCRVAMIESISIFAAGRDGAMHHIVNLA